MGTPSTEPGGAEELETVVAPDAPSIPQLNGALAPLPNLAAPPASSTPTGPSTPTGDPGDEEGILS